MYIIMMSFVVFFIIIARQGPRHREFRYDPALWMVPYLSVSELSSEKRGEQDRKCYEVGA